MKLTRSEFIAAAAPLLLGATATAAYARARRNLVVNGIVKDVKENDGTFKMQRKGGRGSGGVGLKVVITTDEDTKYLRSDETEGSFEDIVEEVRVQVKGRLNQDGSILAKRILIKVTDPKEEELVHA